MRVYDCRVAPGVTPWSDQVRFDSPDDDPAQEIVGGDKAEPPAFSIPGGFAVKVGEKGVMSGRNWSRVNQRKLMHRQGVEDVKGGTPVVAPPVNKQRRRQATKAELREQAEAAVRAWREGQISKNK